MENKESRREATIAGLQEEARDREVAKDYRRLSAHDFLMKYGTYIEDDGVYILNAEVVRSIDFGIEVLDWMNAPMG